MTLPFDPTVGIPAGSKPAASNARTVPERVAAIEAECSGVWASYGVDAYERSFLNSIRNKTDLSIKQEELLKRIENRVFGDAN